MDKEPKFQQGDEVYTIQDIVSHRLTGSPLESWKVENPCDKTDMKRVGGLGPVYFYVRLEGMRGKQHHSGRGYHQQNLVLAKEYDPNKEYRGV